jgi:nucleoid-associated protein YgaU
MPTPARKLSAAAALVAGGVACAWPFRLTSETAPAPAADSAQQASADPAEDAAELGASLVGPPANVSATTWRSGPPDLSGGATPTNDTSVSAATASLAHPWSGGPPPPGLGPAPSTSPGEAENDGQIVAQERIAAYRFAYPSVNVPAVEEAPSGEYSPVIRYVIHEGDSLAKLAQRYLGDESRALELFDHNRATLENPYLLPIGAEIEIPRERRIAPTDVH